jgi:glycosyltransferase involved in cell wall biosynthesis
VSLSICMIVKNEAHCIERCLDSIIPIADEIIVVDTGSTDGTQDIVREKIGRVYSKAWNDSFADARNFSLSLASQKWVMWVDADDTIPDEIYPLIRGIVEGAETNRYYVADVENIGGNLDVILYRTFKQARLFPNHKGIKFVNRIHEQFVSSAIENGVCEAGIDGLRVLHHGYADENITMLKRKRNIRLMMQNMGYPPNTKYFEFDIGKNFCLYTPNVLSVWSMMQFAGVAEPFKDRCPDDPNERREMMVACARKIIADYETKQEQKKYAADILALDGVAV